VCGWLTEQLNAARQKVAELTPASEEVASLRIKEADARRHADEAEEKFVALAERACLDAMEAEQVWKERDELLQTMVRLRQEHTNAHQWIKDLPG
jgi:6-phosphofructokinase